MTDFNDRQNCDVQKKSALIVPYKDNNERNILLAEDDYEMRAILALVLERAGYKVVMCPDGWSLLEHLESHILTWSKHEKVDLVISDIRMPGITGMEILRGLPREVGYPPVILITAFGDKKTHHQAEKFGVAAIFDKPFDMDELMAKVRKILPLQN